MAQHDFNIANQSFPSFRTDLNNALSAINTSQSGTSRPSGAVSGTIWLDTTSATTPTLKYYDGADDISLATLDHSANTVNWLDSTVSITGLTTTATGTVLTLSDSASTSTVNLIIDNQKEIRFRETTANGTNYIGLKAPASVTADLTFTLPVAPTVNNQALISTTAGVMAFTPYTFPTSDGTASQVLQTNGSGVLSFGSVAPSGTITIDNIQFPATQVASANANNLDDYEEGTWTPTYSTAGGGESVTYAIQSGKYTKIGNCVYFQFVLMTNSFTGGSSTIKASLPFTPSTATQVMASCGEAAAWTTNCPTTTFASSSTAFVFFLRVSGTGTTDITTANVTAGSNKNLINCGGFYYTA
jgi:hypothetical protein